LLLTPAGLAWDEATRHHSEEQFVRQPNPDANPKSASPTINRRHVLGTGLTLTAGALAGTHLARAAEGSTADARLLPGFKVERVKVTGAELHTVIGGSGPPLLLLHGAPLTHLSWYRVAPELARHFTVVAPDLRGYGDSSKPEDGVDHINYSKRTMAQDNVELMRHFGFERFALVGHDRGGRVAHRLALDHPQVLTRMSVLDIVPTHYLYTNVTKAFVDAYFHWFLYIRPAPFPENILNADIPGNFGRSSSPELRAEYIRVFSNPATVHAMCEDYRASAGIDMKFDEADLAKKITCPLFVLWATDAAMGRMYDVLGIWKERGTQVTGAGITGGHNLQESNPAGTLAQLLPFLKA
jgi:haloacetate dehalogenase